MSLRTRFLRAALLVWPLGLTASALAQAAEEAVAARAEPADSIVVTARRKVEAAKSAPIPLSVVSGGELESKGSYHVGRLTQLQPTLQFYSSNPRNSAISIRGLGAPFGLTNDGIEPGVGIYICAAELQRLRPADRHRLALAGLPESRRRLRSR